MQDGKIIDAGRARGARQPCEAGLLELLRQQHQQVMAA